jgi:predicted ATPase/DNA-binding winged helix-turn-helix (wHTH) protein/Tfp pilus assembly protein PilF
VSLTFGPFTLDPDAFRLERDGQLVSVQPKVLEALCMLVARGGQLVGRQELQSSLWPNVTVTEQSLRQVIRKLRDVLDDNEASPRYIATVHGKGYRFVATLRSTIPASSIPAERDLFVGRRQQLAELGERVARSRMVTVLGMGGVGKTRLVQHFIGQWTGPAWFCMLAEARQLDGVVAGVARVLEVQLKGGDSSTQLGYALAARGPCLVILDNFEQVTPWAGATVGRWLDLAPEARFVVTSREILGLPGEDALVVPPMPAEEAVELFVARSVGLEPERDGPAIRELAVALDGLPLALELAAARTRLLSLAEIRARMSDRFRLLSAGGRRVDRHATLRAVLDWSWSLLSPDEQHALVQLSVFEGPFSPESAEALIDRPDALDLLQALIDRSLLYRRAGALAMLLTVQEYALEKLSPAERAEAELRHGVHFASLKARPETLDNVVAACRRAIARPSPQVAVGALRAVWEVVRAKGPLPLAMGLTEEVLGLGLSPMEEFTALRVAAEAHRSAYQSASALSCAERALVLARTHGSPTDLAAALELVGFALSSAQRPQEAEEVLSQAIPLVQDMPSRLASVRGGLAMTAWSMGRREEAQARFQSALAAGGDLASNGWILTGLASIQLEMGELDRALSSLQEALGAIEPASLDEANTLSWYGMALYERAEFAEARRACERAVTLTRRGGWRRHQGWALLNLGRVLFELADDSTSAIVEEAAALHREDGQDRPLALCLATQGTIAAARGEPDVAWELGQQALALPHTRNDLRALPILLYEVAQSAPEPAARTLLAEAASWVERLTDRTGQVIVGAAVALTETGPEAEARLDEAQRWLEERGHRRELARLLLKRARRALAAGDEASGHELAARGAELVPAGSRLARELAAARG